MIRICRLRVEKALSKSEAMVFRVPVRLQFALPSACTQGVGRSWGSFNAASQYGGPEQRLCVDGL